MRYGMGQGRDKKVEQPDRQDTPFTMWRLHEKPEGLTWGRDSQKRPEDDNTAFEDGINKLRIPGTRIFYRAVMYNDFIENLSSEVLLMEMKQKEILGCT